MKSYLKWYLYIPPAILVLALMVWIAVKPAPRTVEEPVTVALPESPAVTAQGAPASGVVRAEGIRVPDYDENGMLKSEVFGDMARELPDGNIEIFNLRLLLYKAGRLDGTAETTRCIYNRKEKLLFSNAEITLQQGNMLVSGVGFRWYTDKQVMEILNRSFVIVRDARSWASKEGRIYGHKK